MLSVVGNVTIDREASKVTSSISTFGGPTRFFKGAHRGMMCVRVFIEMTVRSYL